ncbi:putative phosphoserine phosphatase 2 [compost metagenome]
MAESTVKHLYLIRHCRAEGQEPEAQLTPEGKEQAKELVDFFMDIEVERCISSPYVRAVDTITPLCEARQLALIIEENLKERVLSSIHLDNWMDKLRATYEDVDLKFPGGESTREAMNRGVEVINQLLRRDESNMVVVTHGALMSLIIRHFDSNFGFDQWTTLSNPDVYRLDFVEQSFHGVTRVWRNN